MTQSQFIRRVVKPMAFAACLIPFGLLVYHAFSGGLGANPIEEITHRTGKTTIVLLMVTLAVSPIRRLTGWGAVISLRRMLGLFAFFYVCLHFATYIVDQSFALEFIVEDVAKRPYVTVGFTSFVLLIPLAVTSTKGWIKRLGGKRWNQIHKLVYVAAAGGVLHYLWLVKADTRTPIIFGLILIVLLATRLKITKRRTRKAESAGASSTPVLETR